MPINLRPFMKISTFCTLLLLSSSCIQQAFCATQTDSIPDQKGKILAIPVVFYTPDTRLGLGAGGIYTWRSEGARYPNSVNFSGAWTVRKQVLLWFPFQYYAPQTRWQTYGELGYFKYIFDYFGIGNQVPRGVREKYNATFPRLRLNVLKSVRGAQHFAGLRYYFDQFAVQINDTTALLAKEQPLGVAGGTTSGIGLVWLTDTRDQRFYPRKGMYGEAVVYRESAWTGSSFDFTRLSIDWAKYSAFGKYHTLVTHGSITLTPGKVPFYSLAHLGGTKRLRGYVEGTYRDKNAALLQTEWRSQWSRRWGGVVWAAAGSVWGTPSQTARIRPNAGLGLRFTLDTAQHLNIRADYGFGDRGNRGFYLTIGEAF
jgi:outer membrane protein assembly factor BamA